MGVLYIIIIKFMFEFTVNLNLEIVHKIILFTMVMFINYFTIRKIKVMIVISTIIMKITIDYNPKY